MGMDDEDELRFDAQSRTSFDRFDPTGLRFHGESPALGSEQGNDNDSVQNAINSILDLHDRGGVQTPDDLNNLHGCSKAWRLTTATQHLMPPSTRFSELFPSEAFSHSRR